MERVKTFVDSIRDRLNNPFVFSFIVSWIFFNWKITIALFWDNPTGSVQSQFSLINYIESNISLWNSLLGPVVSAASYTIISPIVKNLITAFQNWNFTWGENWNIHILKQSKVTMEKYLSLRKNYDSRSKELEQILLQEGEMSNTILQLKSDLSKLKFDLESANRELNEAKEITDNLNDVNLLEGKWVKIVKNPYRGVQEENIQISGNNVSVYDGSTLQNMYSIHNFIYHKKHNYVYFSLFKDNHFHSFNALNALPSKLAGFQYENGGRSDVVYARSINILAANANLPDKTED
jgi:hypothetical protein